MEVIEHETHGDLGWRPTENLLFAKNMSYIPLASSEIAIMAHSLPVLFQQSKTGWQTVVLCGLIDAMNLCISSSGKFISQYTPLFFRLYPFEVDQSGAIALQDGYQTSSLTDSNAHPFFENGHLSERLNKTKDVLAKIKADKEAMHQNLSTLMALGLLTPLDINAKDSTDRGLKSLFIIDLPKLGKITDKTALKLFRTDAFPWIYAHAASLIHLSRLKDLAQQRMRNAQPKGAKASATDDLIAAMLSDKGKSFL